MEKIAGLKNTKESIEYLNAIASQGDIGELLFGLHNVALAQGGFALLSNKTGLSRESLYKTLHPKGNPHLNTFMIILKSLGFVISFEQEFPRWCKQNTNLKTLADICPGLVKQWCQNKNIITPDRISPISKRKVWWKCPFSDEHTWQATCHSRTVKNNGCPYCAGIKSVPSNCLQTLYPELANQWHPIKNGNLTPKNTPAGSNRKVWWLCQKGHEWKSFCNSRTGNNRSDCPLCTKEEILNYEYKKNK